MPNEELARVAELISTGMMDDERESHVRQASPRQTPFLLLPPKAPPLTASDSHPAQQKTTPPKPNKTKNKKPGRAKVGAIAGALGVTVGEAKHMAYRKKALLQDDPQELAARLEAVAAKAGLPLADARRVVALQPGMLLGDAEAAKQAEALAGAVRVLAYELRAPQNEIVRLILDNPSVLHGRDARLSAADVAHLAALREPTGRIAVD